MMPDLWGPAFGFALSAGGAGLTLRYGRQTAALDIPNPRSSHRVPTPRGGGIALVTSVIAVGAYELGRLGQRPNAVLAFLTAGLLMLTFVGWLDDRGSMPVSLRLAVHLTCGVSVALLVNQIAPVPGPINLIWLTWWVFWSVSSINIVNFMDGIDGMVACQGIVYGIFLFALLPSSLSGSRFGLALAAACSGFLLWNWAPAKMFMGDVGSGPLGLFFVIGGALALEGAPTALIFLPLFPLFFDALATLVQRFRKREKLTAAHRSHLYQRLANGGAGHAVVTSVYALAAALGALVALSVKNGSSRQISVAILAYCLAVAVAWKTADSKLSRHVARLSVT
jgi:UDP-N-acetylmuramyl pentapeptide phosphotransferase/UDP-N-acetylglucosamine-1-phosphate transferase